MPTLSELKGLNADRWKRAKISPDRKAEVMLTAKRLLAGKPRYQAVETRTGVPWFIIAVLHEREASGRFDRQLGQGDPLDHVSVHEPKGRGPFKSWEDGAYDALVLCPPFATRNKDWTCGGALTLTLQYNGLGPENVHHIPSGYVWGATNIEERGKYTSDGHWNGSVWDAQIGTAALLMGMKALDPSVCFSDDSSPIAVPAPAAPPLPQEKPAEPPVLAPPETSRVPPYQAPQTNAPAASPEAPKAPQTGFWSTLATSLLGALFTRK